MASRAAQLVLAAACCLLLAHGVAGAPKTVSLTTTILTIPGWTEYDHIQAVMNSYGAPYEIREIQPTEIETGSAPLNMTQFLTNPDGSGRVGFIIATPANVLNIFGGILSLNQINDIYAYQAAYGVRAVLEGPYVPTVGSDIAGGPPGLGVALVNANTPAPAVVTASVANTAPLTTSGVKAGAPMDLTGLYTTPVTITNTSRSTPVANVVTPASYAGYTAVTTKFDTGREQFTTFYPCAAFASDCLLTAHIYYAWGMHGILPGARDSLFSVQIDDLFLATEEPFNTSASYRMTKADSTALATFAANVPNLPAGSSFRIEIVYNNGGYISQTQPDQYFEVWSDTEPNDTLQTFQKPPGSGVSLMPSNPDTSWWNATLWKANDPLYNEIAFGSSGMQYFLGHHTFTHENMNNVTYNDAFQQIRLNQKAAGYWNTTNGKFNRFSQTAMVTPAISGLRNVDALQALLDTGITAGTGDTSWPHLRNQANPWQAQVLSVAANQTVDGFYIIPRSPTEVYYDVSTEAVEAQLYNWFYCCNFTANPSCPKNGCEAGKPFTVPSSWTDILNREAARVMRLMLALRPDGHMFHQANVRSTGVGQGKGSLLQQWITKIMATYSSKVSWPLVSMKLDDQLAFHKKRIQRDACAPQYTLTYDDVTKSASSLRISSGTGGCDAPVMIASTAVTGANPSPRVLGSEPRLYTATIPAGGGSKTLTLGSAIKWS